VWLPKEGFPWISGLKGNEMNGVVIDGHFRKVAIASRVWRQESNLDKLNRCPAQANKHPHEEPKYEVGDLVYLSTKNLCLKIK